jgi:hypothetical protein
MIGAYALIVLLGGFIVWQAVRITDLSDKLGRVVSEVKWARERACEAFWKPTDAAVVGQLLGLQHETAELREVVTDMLRYDVSQRWRVHKPKGVMMRILVNQPRVPVANTEEKQPGEQQS